MHDRSERVWVGREGLLIFEFLERDGDALVHVHDGRGGARGDGCGGKGGEGERRGTWGGRRMGRRVRTLVKGSGVAGDVLTSKGVGELGLERYGESAHGMETVSEAETLRGMILSNSQDERREKEWTKEWTKTRAVTAPGKPRRNDAVGAINRSGR